MITAAIIDDPDDANVLSGHLKSLKIKVVVVGSNRKDTIEIYKKYKPDIMFLGITTEFDCVYAVKKIRGLDTQANIIIAARNLDGSIIEELKNLQPTHIVKKPFDIDEIAALLQKTDFPIRRIDQAKAALVSFVIEQSLFKISSSTPQQVGDRLYAEYGCYFADCLEHPQYLKAVLQEVFGNGSNAIINTIRENLIEFEDQHPISNFLSVIHK